MGELIIKIQELIKELNTINQNINVVRNFLEKYEPLFQSEKGIEAISDIKEYLFLVENKKDELIKELNILKKEIRLICNHEILRKDEDIYSCKICGKQFEPKQVKFKHYLLEYNRILCEKEIEEIINFIITNNLNIFESFEDYICQNKKLNQVKVYRSGI